MFRTCVRVRIAVGHSGDTERLRNTTAVSRDFYSNNPIPYEFRTTTVVARVFFLGCRELGHILSLPASETKFVRILSPGYWATSYITKIYIILNKMLNLVPNYTLNES